MADKDCKDFSSQNAAQAFFTSHGGSSTNNVDGLDHDHDGQACETFPYKEVSTGGQATQTTTATQQGNSLPMTGSHTEPIAIGGSLVLLLGVAMVLIGRRRTARR